VNVSIFFACPAAIGSLLLDAEPHRETAIGSIPAACSKGQSHMQGRPGTKPADLGQTGAFPRPRAQGGAGGRSLGGSLPILPQIGWRTRRSCTRTRGGFPA